MADQTQVVIDLANMIVNQAGSLMNAIEKFGDINDWGTSAGINFADYSDAIDGQASLKHADATRYNQVAGIIAPALIAWLQTQSSGGKTFWKILQMTRRA